MVSFNELLARRSLMHFAVFLVFVIAVAIFILNKGLEIVSDIETIENAPLFVLRKKILTEGSIPEIRKWRLYRNSDYGFEVRFPPTYQLDAKSIKLTPASKEMEVVVVEGERKLNGEVEKNPSADAFCYLQLIVTENPKRLTLTEFSRKSNLGLFSSEEFISVDGEQALRRSGNDMIGNQITEVYISYRNRIFTFMSSVDVSVQPSAKCREEFELIISTIRFIR